MNDLFVLFYLCNKVTLQILQRCMADIFYCITCVDCSLTDKELRPILIQISVDLKIRYSDTLADILFLSDTCSINRFPQYLLCVDIYWLIYAQPDREIFETPHKSTNVSEWPLLNKLCNIKTYNIVYLNFHGIIINDPDPLANKHWFSDCFLTSFHLARASVTNGRMRWYLDTTEVAHR